MSLTLNRWLLDDFGFGGGLVPIESLQNQPNCILYPNPIEDFLFIKPSSDQIQTLSIYSISGELIHEMKAGGELTTINVSEMKPGVYILNICYLDGSLRIIT